MFHLLSIIAVLVGMALAIIYWKLALTILAIVLGVGLFLLFLILREFSKNEEDDLV
jgi:Zn-dependent protease with chaperone function